MDILRESGYAFRRLMDCEYIMTVGKKQKNHAFKISFGAEEFKHLAGLHYLVDLDVHSISAKIVFLKVLDGSLNEQNLRESIYFYEIEQRLRNLARLEHCLDNNMLVFRWETKNGIRSDIIADYALKENTAEKEKTYAFLRGRESKFSVKNTRLTVEAVLETVVVSTFLDSQRDKTMGQMEYTLVKNEKIYLPTGLSTVLYDLEEIKRQRTASQKASSSEPPKLASHQEPQIAQEQAELENDLPKIEL